MLRPKQLAFLAGVVVLLVAIAIVQKTNHRRTVDKSAQVAVLDGAWTRDDVARITIGYGEDEEAVALDKGPDGWIVSTSWQAKASDQRLDALLKVLSRLTGEFRSDSADVLADYGLDEGAAVTIRAWDGDGQQVIALDVGHAAGNGQGQFVRRPGENAVYMSDARVLGALGLYSGPAQPQSRFFLDLQAVQEDKTAIDAITLTDDHGTRTMTKVFAPEPATADSAAADTTAPKVDRLTWEWELTAPKREPLAKTKADGVLGGVAAIRAVDVVDPAADPATYGLDRPSRQAVLTFADGHTVTLDFGKDREKEGDAPAGTYLRVDDGPTVWVVTPYTVNNIFKTVEDLRPQS